MLLMQIRLVNLKYLNSFTENYNLKLKIDEDLTFANLNGTKKFILLNLQ